ncbi:MAG TPA: ribonuclease P protein component [Candidatus Gracilibacteria bacterium]|nr:ribonuclease P protein component [Candidatus Gracilibacteria bacterium]
MLARKWRIRHDWEIKKILNNGEKKHFPLFYLLVRARPQGHWRAKVLVSKKYDKRAVKRNQLRRRWQEAVYSAWQNSNFSADVLIFPHAKSLASPFTELVQSLQSCFKN